MRKTYQVNEIFTTVQGEGVLVGTPATFIRLQGCTVGCVWCDTKYTWLKGGKRLTVRQVLAQVTTRHVVITGGEPTLYNLDSLIAPLKIAGHFVQVETSGQQFYHGAIRPDWTTWSPKENLGWDTDDRMYRHCHEVKWVVDEALTFQTVEDRWNKMLSLRSNSLKERPTFVLMPEGCPPKDKYVDKTLEWLLSDIAHRNLWRFGDRLQWRLGVR